MLPPKTNNSSSISSPSGTDEMMRALIENSKDAISLSDADLIIKYISPAITDILGYSPEELIGTSSTLMMHPTEITEKVNIRQKIAPGSTEHMQLRAIHKDGSWRWLSISITNHLDDPAIKAMVTNIRDITEQIDMKAQLDKSNEDLRKLFNTIDEVLYSVVIDGYRLTQMSDACLKVSGYPVEDFFENKNLWFEVILPEDRHVPAEVGLQLDKGLTATGQYRIRHKDGNIRWIEATLVPTLDEHGTLIRMDGVNRDVTDKKNAEEALLHSEGRYRALIENNKEGIALTGPDRKFTYISPQIKDLFGYEPEELIDSHPLDMYHPDDHVKIFTFVESIADDKPHTIEGLRIRCKDGSWKWIELTFSNQFDNPSVNAMVCNFRDITDKKLAAEALIDSEKRFRTLIENNKEGIGLTDNLSRFIYVSPSTMGILGYSPEELMGSNAFDLYHPDDLPLMKELAIGIREAFGTYSTATVRIRHKDGTWRWIELTANNQLDDHAVRAIVTNFRDVTERKKAAEELESLNQSLEKKVQERTIQLEESNKALESFSYMAAHDLQAPLRILSGYASILKNEYYSDLNEDARDLLGTIVLKTKHMSQLVSDLLGFSRASHMMMREDEVDFDEMARSIADQISLSGGISGRAEIVIQKLGSHRCDASLMSQVWANLISNAMKYSSKKENPRIEIGQTKSDDETIFYIKDNGTGFDMQYAEQLFDVFKRLHSANEYEGNGVGLALVKQVITRHKGRIWVEAIPQEGATFYFSLPD